MTQATFSSREPATSHNSLHANRPSNPRTGFGVHAPTPSPSPTGPSLTSLVPAYGQFSVSPDTPGFPLLA